jgi:O-antigen/teichoic acid export membrane protein
MTPTPRYASSSDQPGAMTPVMARLLPLIVLGTALSSVANITLTRNMSADEYGAFSFFLSTINLMSLIGLLGFQQTLPHFLSRYERERKPGLTLGFMITILVLVVVATAVATVVGIYAVVPFIRDTASHRCLSDGYYMATAFALIVLLTAYLNYHKQTLVSSSAGPNGAIYQFILIVTVLLALLLPHRHKGLLAVEAVAAMGIAACVCLLIQGVWCAIKAKSEIRGIRPHFQVKEWLLGSLPVGGSALLGVLIYAADVIAVRLISGSGSAATYAVASSLASFVIIPRSAITRYFSQEAPHVAGADRSSSLQRLIRKVLGFHLLCAGAIGACILFFNQPLLGLYGSSYQSAWPVLILLIVARVLEGPASIGIKLLNLEGHGSKLAMTNLWTGVIFIALLAGLVSLLGPEGAALAVIAFVLLSAVLYYRSTMKYSGLRLAPFVPGLPLRQTKSA